MPVKWPPLWHPCLPKINHGGPDKNVFIQISVLGHCGPIVILLDAHFLHFWDTDGLGIKCNNDKVLQSGKSDQGELANYEPTFLMKNVKYILGEANCYSERNSE